MDNKNTSETIAETPVYNKIDTEVVNESSRYVTESKINEIEKTNTMKKLMEEALRHYMNSFPIKAKTA